MEQDLRRQVLNILEKNSRLSPAEIAVMTGTDEQTVADMISALEKRALSADTTPSSTGIRKMMIP